MSSSKKTGSIILAAGRGSRMKAYDGNKVLLPLIPGKSPYEGRVPILLHILENLPPGPKAIVVHHKKDDIIKATRDLGVAFCSQPILNGTGGALLATRPFIESLRCEETIITMGDIPFVRTSTYERLTRALGAHDLVVLGFSPKSKKHYGVLEIDGERVKRIVEWKYWRRYPRAKQQALTICNSGIYGTKKGLLVRYLSVLASHPHVVEKEINSQRMLLEEYFITDLVEYMDHDGLSVGYVMVEDEKEVMGIDDVQALRLAQELFRATYP